MKTLANCPLSEFLPAAYKLREAFHKYYHLLNMDGLREKYMQQMQGIETEEQKAAVSKNYMDEMFRLMMLDHAAETVELIAMLGFMSREEAEKLMPDEALGILVECIRSERVMDFFISLERTAGGTDGILRTLILLRLSASVTDTSATASQNSTNATNGSASAGDTPENA